MCTAKLAIANAYNFVCVYVFHRMYKLEADLHGCFAKLAIANAYACVPPKCIGLRQTSMDVHGIACNC